MATFQLNNDCKAFLRFCKQYLFFVEGEKGGQALSFEPWQIRIINDLLARDPKTGRRKHTTAYIGLPKGNNKSTMGAALALFFLMYESSRTSDTGMQIFAVAASRDQAKIVFMNARRMVEASVLLQDWINVSRDALYVPSTGASFQVLSSDAPKLHGKRPSIVICDELHAHESGEAYTALLEATITRSEPLVITITNAGANERGEHVCAQVYRQGKSGFDESMYFYSPTVSDEEVDDHDAWMRVNPASWITLDKLISLQKKMPQSEFERFHLNRWTRAEKDWLPKGAWAACEAPVSLSPGEVVVIGVDMSRSHDSTAVTVVAPRSDDQFVAVTETWAAWQDPSKPSPKVHHVIEESTIPFQLVFDRVRELCATYQVREIVYDPYGIPNAVSELLEAEGLPMVRYDQSTTRMIPACAGLFDAIVSGKIQHDGDEIFTNQIAAATVKSHGHRGWTLDKTKSRDHMDSSISLALAVDRAKEYVASANDLMVRWFS